MFFTVLPNEKNLLKQVIYKITLIMFLTFLKPFVSVSSPLFLTFRSHFLTASRAQPRPLFLFQLFFFFLSALFFSACSRLFLFLSSTRSFTCFSSSLLKSFIFTGFCSFSKEFCLPAAKIWGFLPKFSNVLLFFNLYSSYKQWRMSF